MLGALEGEAGAAQTNGPGLNGVSTARPVKGGSLTFGIDTEESGFNPSSARWDEGGFLYGRCVFDPIAVVGQVPLLIAANAASPYDSMQSLLAAAKAKPGTINVAHPSVTSLIIVEYLKV